MTLKETREFIFSQMLDLKEGKVSIDEVLVSIKGANAIVNVFQLELNAVNLAANIGKPPESYIEVVEQIEGK